MADYDNRLSGALFKNDKEGNEKRPDYKGSFTDGEGREFWVSSWVKKDKNGKMFMSLSMQAKEVKGSAQAPVAPNDSEDELPF